MKKVIIKRNNRQFECEVVIGDSFHGHATVRIKEILHPNRKFFKTEFFGNSYGFWIEDYDSIFSAIEEKVDEYLKEEYRDSEISRKIQEFKNMDLENSIPSIKIYWHIQNNHNTIKITTEEEIDMFVMKKIKEEIERSSF